MEAIMIKLLMWVQDPIVFPKDFLQNPSINEDAPSTYRCTEAGKTIQLREGMAIYTKEYGPENMDGLDLNQQIEAVSLAKKENRYHWKKWKIESRERNPGMCRCCNHEKYLVMVHEKEERSFASSFFRKVFFTIE